MGSTHWSMHEKLSEVRFFGRFLRSGGGDLVLTLGSFPLSNNTWAPMLVHLPLSFRSTGCGEVGLLIDDNLVSQMRFDVNTGAENRWTKHALPNISLLPEELPSDFKPFERESPGRSPSIEDETVASKHGESSSPVSCRNETTLSEHTLSTSVKKEF